MSGLSPGGGGGGLLWQKGKGLESGQELAKDRRGLTWEGLLEQTFIQRATGTPGRHCHGGERSPCSGAHTGGVG